jgi:hypothetical protein
LNAAKVFVTSVRPSLSAWATMCRAFLPIGRPVFTNAVRMAPHGCDILADWGGSAVLGEHRHERLSWSFASLALWLQSQRVTA